MLTESEKRFVQEIKVARLGTVSADGEPQIQPICFALHDDMIFITVDRKPKKIKATGLKRLKNIAANPRVAVLVDHYDENWDRLGWVMLRGLAEIVTAGEVHDRAQSHLIARYPQYRKMIIQDLPVIAITITQVSSWGNLSGGEASSAITLEDTAK